MKINASQLFIAAPGSPPDVLHKVLERTNPRLSYFDSYMYDKYVEVEDFLSLEEAKEFIKREGKRRIVII